MKAAVAAALLVALVAAVSATTYTTIITTTSYEEGGRQGQGQGQCKQQVQGREFQSCQSYLKQGRGNQQQEYVDQCCRELKEMDRYQCGCEAIRHAVQKAQHGSSYPGPGGSTYPGGQGQGQGQQLYDRARELPRRCGLSQQECRFNLVFV